MNKSNDTLRIISRKISDIYSISNSVMIGGNADGVDLLLHLLHDIYSEATGIGLEFESRWLAERARVQADVMWFAGHYRTRNPNAEEKEIVAHVIDCWRNITESLQIPLVDPTWVESSDKE